MSKKNRAEAEIKFKLRKAEFDCISETLKKEGFGFANKEKLTDYFIEKNKSPHGGWDFERLRVVNRKKFLFTDKKWVLDRNKIAVRLEKEKHITKTKAQKLLAQRRGLIKVSKTRINFKGHILKNIATVSVDDLEINKRHYYFLEVEIITTIAKSTEARNMIKNWVIKELNIKDTKEAPSILDFLSRFN